MARAPAGVVSQGPAVFEEERFADTYREMGWTVTGPYVAVAALLSDEAVDAATAVFNDALSPDFCDDGEMRTALTAAIAAAERTEGAP